ncbi:MarC family protein [Fictibacillus sp. B-59209]|uniref:MarC family protein n=1 Tax=Fictibacillus sp. B-59209 TaxID=3024873 RepID=UPI002E20E060|nr:MarC family protein [Fictibacillus sp. B-59209]
MLTLILKLTVSFFAVMNPLGNIPIFLSLTSGYSLKEKHRTARKAAIISFIILTVFLLLGNLIFSFFGITIHAFRVAGGILIFGIAYNLLHAKTSKAQSLHHQEQKEAELKDDISITPLALPIIAGPGTIASVMAHTSSHSLENLGSVFISYILVLAATFILFFYSTSIITKLGENGLNVISRLMGLILAVMAIQMIAEGAYGLFLHLK